MNLITVKDLKAPKYIREQLSRYGNLMLTNNGKPMALMLDIPEGDNPADLMEALREAQARLALTRMRENARRDGRSQMTKDEILAEIKETRKHQRTRS